MEVPCTETIWTRYGSVSIALGAYTTRSDMSEPTEPCKCEAMMHIGKPRSGTSRHMNKEIPHFHRTDENGNTYIVTSTGRLSPVETSAVEQIIEEHRQLEMFDADPTYGGMFANKFDDLQDGDMAEKS